MAGAPSLSPLQETFGNAIETLSFHLPMPGWRRAGNPSTPLSLSLLLTDTSVCKARLGKPSKGDYLDL